MVWNLDSWVTVHTVGPILWLSLNCMVSKQTHSGVFQLLVLVKSFVSVFVPRHFHEVVQSWGQTGRDGQGLTSWPTDFTRDIRPIRCHSHNDYWRQVPLYSAICAGCISVEADVWLVDRELYVGHTTSSLTRNSTLTALYIDPLMDILAKQNPTTEFHSMGNTSRNGIFDTDPSQSLTLLIDFKTEGPATWPYVMEAIEPLRSANYLSHWNGSCVLQGPVVVVGTGNAPFGHVISNTSNPHKDIFLDAPLDELRAEISNGNSSRPTDNPTAQIDRITYNSQNSYFASVAFGKAIGRLWRHGLSEKQLSLLRGQIRTAHTKGLKVRYWDLPNWPIGLRNHVWDVLITEGVDLLNVDDLEAASRWNWAKGSMSKFKP